MKGSISANVQEELSLRSIVTSRGTLTGSIVKTGSMRANIQEELSLRGTVVSSGILTGSIVKTETLVGHAVLSTEYKVYTGAYSVTPKVDPQTLNTSDKLMTQDMKIKAIPYYSVSNEYNGETIIIGGNS